MSLTTSVLQYSIAVASAIILIWSVLLAAWMTSNYKELKHKRLVNIIILLALILGASYLSQLAAVFFIIAPPYDLLLGCDLQFRSVGDDLIFLPSIEVGQGFGFWTRRRQ